MFSLPPPRHIPTLHIATNPKAQNLRSVLMQSGLIQRLRTIAIYEYTPQLLADRGDIRIFGFSFGRRLRLSMVAMVGHAGAVEAFVAA